MPRLACDHNKYCGKRRRIQTLFESLAGGPRNIFESVINRILATIKFNLIRARCVPSISNIHYVKKKIGVPPWGPTAVRNGKYARLVWHNRGKNLCIQYNAYNNNDIVAVAKRKEEKKRSNEVYIQFASDVGHRRRHCHWADGNYGKQMENDLVCGVCKFYCWHKLSARLCRARASIIFYMMVMLKWCCIGCRAFILPYFFEFIHMQTLFVVYSLPWPIYSKAIYKHTSMLFCVLSS